MVIVINSVIGGFDRKDQVWLGTSTVRLSNYTVRLQLYRTISEK